MSYKYGEFRTPTPGRTSRLFRILAKSPRARAAVLQGRVLVIDPSCGSLTSQPGYAIGAAGVPVDSGVIDMPTHRDLAKRLAYLGRSLREEFTEKFDVVAVEDVPSHRFKKTRGGKVKASFRQQISLHKAVAVVESNFPDAAYVLYVSPATWRTYASEEHLHAKDVLGERTDEEDAQAMLCALVEIARAAEAYRPRKKKATRKKTGGK